MHCHFFHLHTLQFSPIPTLFHYLSLFHFTSPLHFRKQVNKKLSYRRHNTLTSWNHKNAIPTANIILLLSVPSPVLAWGIMFSNCPFVDPSVRPSVRLSVTSLWTLYFENEWTDFNGTEHERSTLMGSGGQRSRSLGDQNYTWKPGGDIILDPLSRVDRDMQWATEIFNVALEKGSGGVEHSCNCAPPPAFAGYASCWRTC